MKEEIYIDSNPVDLDDDTNITLNYRSNFLSDVSKIVSNNTYSIKLPMTARNRKVIDMSHLPSCVTNWPRINHKGRYIRNGVEIVSDANVTLVEISDTIDVAMAWGNVSAFANVVNDGKTLQDLSYGEVEGTDYVVWQKSSTSRRFPDIDYGYSEAETEVWYHPAVTVKWILDRISSDSGVLFTFPSNRSSFIGSLVVPLLTRNDAQSQIDKYAMTFTFLNEVRYDTLEGGYLCLFEEGIQSNYYGQTEFDTFTREVAIYQSLLKNGDVHLWGNITLELTLENTPYGVYFTAVHNEVEMFTVYPLDVETVSSGRYRITYELDDVSTGPIESEHDGAVNHAIRFYIKGVGDVSGGKTTFHSISGSMVLKNRSDKILLRKGTEPDGKFFFVPNLPDMKQIDFIKAISALAGMFAIPSDTGIRFITMEELLGNKSKSVDWTKRVVASYRDNRPKVMSFSLDGFAQENIYKWKDDDEGKYDGTIHVDDETLEDESEVITLPFAGTENKRNRAYIPLYSYDENGELQYDDNVTPRLLMFTGEYSLVAKFDGLDWGSIIAKNYIAYQGVVRQPKVITELIMISEYELRELDMSVPVYLSQYGKYYAIITIKAEKSGICECKLCQLED